MISIFFRYIYIYIYFFHFCWYISVFFSIYIFHGDYETFFLSFYVNQIRLKYSQLLSF